MTEKLLIEFSGKKDLTKYVRMLLAGEAGSGKTKYALTAPNPIWASAYPDSVALAKATNTRYVNINSEQDLLLLHRALKEGLVEAETVVIDRVDEIQRRMFINRMISEKRDFLKNEDWNWMEAKLNQIAKGFCDLELNVIFICQTRDNGGFDGQDFITKPDIQGGFAQDIYSYVDYAVHMERGVDHLVENNVEVLASDLKLSLHTDGPFEVKDSVLRTLKSNRYPWVFDRTETLDSFTSADSYDIIVEARKNMVIEEGNDPLEIVFQPIEDGEHKDTSIPGMSKADKLNKILNKSTQNQKENNASINK
jgi:hypothetical protein